MTMSLFAMLAMLAASLTAAEPPRVRVARSLTGDQIARAITNAPAGARVSVPMSALRMWQAGQSYAPGDVVLRDGMISVCVLGHQAQSGRLPSATPALWRPVKVTDHGKIKPWSKGLAARDAYAMGDRVRHKDYTWQSTINVNVWEPGVYGWTRIY